LGNDSGWNERFDDTGAVRLPVAIGKRSDEVLRRHMDSADDGVVPIGEARVREVHRVRKLDWGNDGTHVVPGGACMVDKAARNQGKGTLGRVVRERQGLAGMWVETIQENVGPRL
jgi:hypothetical protein